MNPQGVEHVSSLKLHDEFDLKVGRPLKNNLSTLVFSKHFMSAS